MVAQAAPSDGTRGVWLVILLLCGVVLVSLSAIKESAIKFEYSMREISSISRGYEPTVIAELPDAVPIPPAKPQSTRRSLLAMSDNRPLQESYADIRAANGYHSLAVAVNYMYAQRWGYDFRFYQIALNETAAAAHGANVAALPRNHDHKHSGACYHVGQRELRSAPWCKLLPSWLAAREARDGWAVYLDSDIIFLDDNRSLEYVLDDPAHHRLTWGAPLANTTIGFIANLPWMSLFPVSCMFWFRPGERAARYMQYWWDVQVRRLKEGTPAAPRVRTAYAPPPGPLARICARL